jgi:hypothetical protein
MMSYRVSPAIELFELASASHITCVDSLYIWPEPKVEPVEVGSKRTRLDVAAVKLPLKSKVGFEHNPYRRTDRGHKRPGRLAVQTTAKGLEVRGEQQHESVVEL